MLTVPSPDPSRVKDQPSQNNFNPEQRLNVREVADLLSIGVSTVWKFVSDGRLPVPERWGARCTRWKLGPLLEAVDRLNGGGGHHG